MLKAKKKLALERLKSGLKLAIFSKQQM